LHLTTLQQLAPKYVAKTLSMLLLLLLMTFAPSHIAC